MNESIITFTLCESNNKDKFMFYQFENMYILYQNASMILNCAEASNRNIQPIRF